MRMLLASIALGASLVGAAEIKPAKDAPQPMSPAESASKIRLPKGFRMELVASEPVVTEPSGVAFDEFGRMFVCELHGYNIEGHLDVMEFNKTGKLDKKVQRVRWELMGGKIAKQAAEIQHGVVKLLVDSDGDGLMDKAEVWAQDLPPCYGLIPARGGIIAVCAPDIVFLADRDLDGKVDVRETLFTGFNVHVLERGINNPRWGLDNWIYVASGSHAGMIQGPHLPKPVYLGNQDFRFKADGTAIEPVSGNCLTFGLTMNDFGDRFPCYGNQPAQYALPLPRRYLIRNPFVSTPENNYRAAGYDLGYRISKPHPWRVRRGADPKWIKFYGQHETDSRGYFSGGCGAQIYRAGLFPEKYHGNYFYCEPSLNMVHRCILTRDGAGYKGHRAPEEQQSEFLASTDQWFRPMNLRIGPDGALYISDMYREIIEDYSAIPRYLQQQYGLDQGGDYGRIWRLVPEDAPDFELPNVSKSSQGELVRATGDENMWWRNTAQRLLIEGGADTAAKELRKRSRDGATAPARVHALYTLDGLRQLTPADVSHALGDESFAVRSHALRLAERWLDRETELLEKVVSMTGETDASARLQLAMTLGESSDSRAVLALVELAERYGAERWMSAAILSSARDSAGEILVGLVGKPTTGQARTLIQPLAATAGGRRSGPQIVRILQAISESSDEVQVDCLAGLVNGLSRDMKPFPIRSDGWAIVKRLLVSESVQVKEAAAKLAARVQRADSPEMQALFANAVQHALDSAHAIDQRQQAMQLLASASYGVLAPAATQLLDARQPPILQQAAIAALSDSNDKRVGSALLKPWTRLTPKTRDTVLKAMFARENRLPTLLDAVENGSIDRGEISAIQREQLTKSGDKAIAERATKLFKNPAAGAELQRRIDEYQAALSGPRDPQRGQVVFTKTCLACHKLKNEGHEVGPALGSVVNKPDEAILLDMLNPSGNIDPEYRSYIVVTEQGHTFTGLLVSESATSVTLRKEKAENETILRQDIEIIKASDLSLMPSNLHEQINPVDAANLIAFLRIAYSKDER